MLDDWRRERQIRQILAGLARQRVALVLQPGNVWIIEKAFKRDRDHEAALRTCLMRGWIEPLQEDVPWGEISPAGDLPTGPIFTNSSTVFRLTDSGWNALNRAHTWTLIGVLIAVGSLATTLLAAS